MGFFTIFSDVFIVAWLTELCKAVSRDWGGCPTCCWIACCMHSFPTGCSLFQFL